MDVQSAPILSKLVNNCFIRCQVLQNLQLNYLTKSVLNQIYRS